MVDAQHGMEDPHGEKIPRDGSARACHAGRNREYHCAMRASVLAVVVVVSAGACTSREDPPRAPEGRPAADEPDLALPRHAVLPTIAQARRPTPAPPGGAP